ncbi:putative signal peptide protein [Puccinia sorghi]|uniref:Putative signal peptide protein n=1 Tax=Puccinia sorghi TaxID=27349 RepID=A0A0L6V139_9BASI|nr:putative signal peptide protein [Puccinia sorghi]
MTLSLVLPLVNAMLTVDIPRQKWNLQLANLNSRQSKEVVGQLDQNYGIPLTINKLSTDLPQQIRTSSSKLREVPGTHWIKVHRNRQKLRLLAQTSSQDVKSPRCTLKEIASFWWNTVKPKTPEDKLLVAHMQDRPGKLKSRKASNLHQEMGIHINPGQDWGATSDKGLSPVVNEKSPESSQHPGESTSKNLIEATTPTNRRNARKKWREISVKVKALSALGILVEKGIEKADNLVVKADHWLEKLNTPITLIHNFLEGWNEFDEMLQILDVFLTSRRNHPNGELEVRP